MPRRDPRITEYIQGRAPFARPVLRYLRRTIHTASPGLEETLKWGMPAFLHRGKIVCGFAGFKAHCALWFWKGESIVGRKSTGAMGNFGRITNMKDLPTAEEITGYVKKAIARIERTQ
jgi:hypothetical protein